MRRFNLFFCLCIALSSTSPVSGAADEIGSVAISKASFNPSIGQQITLAYELPKGDLVTIQVFDPDLGLVRTLIDDEAREAGANTEAWDGRDLAGQLVPDEAYLFTVETASGLLYDPTTHSGGIVGDLTDASFDRQAGTLAYRLPAAARVLIRLGISNGPMLKTLVDWKPRVVGSITEYWDGKDEDDLIDLFGDPAFSTLITYVTLPATTVITYGNRDQTYRDYKLGPAQGRPEKTARPAAPELQKRLRPVGLVPPSWARAPQVSISFPKLASAESSNTPTVGKEVNVRVDVDSADRDRLLEEQFEIIFFVDNVFFAEAERGYLPFNWRWELLQIPPGEHVLTVNVSSFRGQVGVASRKVQVAEK